MLAHNGAMPRRVSVARPYFVLAAGLVVITVGLSPVLDERHVGLASLLYLLVTLLAAARWGYVAGFVAALTGNLILNFFFINPLHRFSVRDPLDLLSLTVFLAVATVGAYMLSLLRDQAARATAHQKDTQLLLLVSREIADASTPRLAIGRLCEVISQNLGAKGCAVWAGEPFAVVGSTPDNASNAHPTRDEAASAISAIRNGQVVRLHNPMGEDSTVTFVPLEGPEPALLRFEGDVSNTALKTELFQALANEVRSALSRARLSLQARRAEDLERSDSFKSLLLSSASHDLRTPLTAIKAAISSLRDDSVSWRESDRSAFLETIDSQTDRLSASLSNLLEMTRIENGLAKATMEPIEVGPLLAEAILATSASTGGRDVTFCVPESLWVRGDYGLLSQALNNLIENAAKYSTPGSPIRLDGTSSGGRVAISVTDAGPGFEQAEAQHVFDKWYRARSGSGAEGTGLGLALVKAIAELNGGSVAAQSTPGSTCFTMFLRPAKAPV